MFFLFLFFYFTTFEVIIILCDLRRQEQIVNLFLEKDMRKVFWSLIIAVFCFSGTLKAEGNLWNDLFGRFDEGKWSGELTSSSVFGGNQFPEDSHDWMAMLNFDYQWPTCQKQSMAIRVVPSLIYYQAEDEKEKDDYIYAGGAGLIYKWYEKENWKGWYFEAGVVPIWNSEQFEGNESDFNFLSSFGLGYEFENNINTALKFIHISNANTNKDNDGINVFALSLGYDF